MSKRMAATLLIETVLIIALLTVALDMKAHSRVERLGGVNVWGYRGPVMRQKAPNEIRIAIAGGDLAFGWGVAASETLVANVRQLIAQALDRPGGRLRQFTSVDLGAIGLPPAQYAGWIQRFSYLKPDVICILPDPRRHHTGNVSVQPDRDSFVFRAFDYAPILPLVVAEKGAVLHSGIVSAAGSIAGALDHGISAIASTRSGSSGRESTADYTEAIKRAVQTALAAGAAVVLVGPPRPGVEDVVDREALAAMVASNFRDEPRVRFVDLGARADVNDDAVWLDGVAMSVAGHAKAASYIASDVLQLVRSLIS